MSKTTDYGRARLLFDPEELRYDFGAGHPFQSRRLVALTDLLQTSGLWQSDQPQTNLPSVPATLEQLGLIHTPQYLAAVQRLSVPEDTLTGQERQERENLALQYGFGDGDTPAIAHMHEITARIAGGSVAALSAIMGLPEGGTFASEEELPLHVFHPAGGLHHAWPERASGFCVYNDIAIAIAHVLRASEAKILYLDFDAHHGDGVQRAFYDEPRVMTVSFHETGRYLFPGTGDVLELGQGLGRGYSVNVPLEAFTEDDSYIEVMNALLPALLISFAPDVIVSLHGCDSHAWDPLTHLDLTMRGIQAQIKLAHELAHTYCQGRWLALGGGGYDQYRVVPRAWSLLWAAMSEQVIPDQLPEEWVKRWRLIWLAQLEEEEAEEEVMGKTLVSDHFPTIFQDRPEDFPPRSRRLAINHANWRTVSQARTLLLPPPVRHAFPHAQRQSAMAGIAEQFRLLDTATPSRSKTIETARETLLLRDFCPLSLVERLQADSGLHAFAHTPEREHQLLLTIARSPDCALSVAHTSDGEIVGEVTLAPGDEWFQGLENAYEVTIQVSSNWRRLGIARQLLAFTLELDILEDVIFFAMGLSWHWDTEGLGLSLHRYREMLKRLFGTQSFLEYQTNEPNIRMEPANILLARVGKRVDQHAVLHFLKQIKSVPRY